MSRHPETPHSARGLQAFTKDTLRTIAHSKKRFVSLVAICALGATMLTGLSMACIDLRNAADALYTQQHLFDISVQSTLGLVEEDLDELAAVDGVETAEGGYEQETYTLVDGLRATVMAKAVLDSGINEPYVVEGELPDAAHEVAVTENYLHEAGKSIGDTLELESTPQEDPTGLSDLDTGGDDDDSDAADEEGDPVIAGGTYTIVGTVIDPTNITQPEGPIAFRAATSSDYTFFVDKSAVVDPATYTVAYLAVSGTEGLSAYSTAYEERVDEVQDRVEDLAPQRERARTEAIKADAYAEIDEAEDEANEQIADAEQELADGQDELDESLAEVLRGQRELDTQRADALAQLADAQATIDSAWADVVKGEADAYNGLATINDTRRTLSEKEQQLNQLEAGKQQAEAGYALAKGYVETAQSEGQQLVDAFNAVPQFDDGSVTDAWNTLSSWTGTDEPVAEEQAFAEAAKTRAEQVAQALSLMSMSPQISSALEQREQVSERLDQIEERLEAITARLQAIDERGADIETALASDDLSDADRNALLSEQQALVEEASSLETEQTSLTTEQETLDITLEVLNAQLKDYDSLAMLSSTLNNLVAGENSQVAQLATGMGQAATGLAQAQTGLDTVNALYEQAGGAAGVAAARSQIAEAKTLLDTQETTINDALAALPSAKEELVAGQAELDEQRADALAQLDDAQKQLDDALEQIADGQTELDEGRATLEEERADAAEQIADARDEVAAVEQATWYVQDRSSLGSFSSVDSDASSIEAIARIIPVIFFVVAILVSLTTATRMVEEERVLIGLYKALGYSKARVLSKYLVYSVSAALIGGVIGDIAGFVVIPYILLYIFQAMYLLPLFSLSFSPFFAVLGIAAFVIGIGGSTFLSCRAELAETPAILMRPKAPRAGSRIFLEHIGPVWRRMSFLNKVTARNLFRYKKRLFMTIFGIMGCTALLICGFSIKNTVESLAPRQYEQIYRYDLMAAVMPEDHETCYDMLDDAPEVTSIESIGVDNVTVEYDGAKESMQLYIIPEGTSIDSYVSLETLDGTSIDLDEAGVVITNNAATVLGLDAGDAIQITTTALDEAAPTVSAITRNYLGNAVYMTEDIYEEIFGPLELNGFFAHLDGSNDKQRAFADTLEDDEEFLSITSVAKMHDQFEESFTLINVVVYVVIGLAAGLAFVVLFTLSTVNIGEREREIATIKVLGFRPREVRTYINKETFVLTGLGILVGIPAGWALSMSFTYILKMPSIYFDVVVAPWCYALAAAFSIVFALAVSLITNRMLDRVIMVEALKSPE